MIHPASQQCHRCLLAADMPGVTIGPDGFCTLCRQAAEHPLAAPAPMTGLWEHVRKSKRPILVALSGGNDSAASLIYLAKGLDLPCQAVLVDNGFIPDFVKQRARALCARLGVGLEVRTIDLAGLLPDKMNDPCQICINAVMELAAERAAEIGARVMATGHLYPPGTWRMPTCYGVLTRVAPLVVDQVREEQRNLLLASAEWDGSIRFASSSNCALLGYLEYVSGRAGNPSCAAAELSHEIRAGLLSRATAASRIARATELRPEYRQVSAILKARGKMRHGRPCPELD